MQDTRPATHEAIQQRIDQEYKWGFVTDIEAESAPPGLNEEIVRFISHKKREPEWLLKWRLKAYRGWLKMKE
ncbi:MAG: Fe-S cluster assembly protein SufB, partial [Planctomycetota bacterium]